MAGVIDGLIEQATAAAAEAKAAQAAQIEAEIEKARQGLATALGPVWAELEPHFEGCEYRTDGGRIARLWFGVRHPDFARFFIVVTRYGEKYLSPRNDGYDSGERAPVEDPVAVGRFFQNQRQRRLEWLAKDRQEQLTKFQRILAGYARETSEEAGRALARLIELEPGHETAWRELYAGWQAGYRRALEQEEEQRRHQEKLEAQKAAYRDAYQTYYAAYRAATARNLAEAERLQTELDVPFHVWELSYGVVASGEGGDQFLEVHTALVLDEVPDRAGYWRAIHNRTGQMETRHFYHPVSRSGALLTRPTEHSIRGNLVAASVTVDGVGEYMRLFFRPTLAADTVEAMLAEQLEALPEEPEFGDLMRSYEIDEIRSQVRREYHEPGDLEDEDNLEF